MVNCQKWFMQKEWFMSPKKDRHHLEVNAAIAILVKDPEDLVDKHLNRVAAWNDITNGHLCIASR